MIYFSMVDRREIDVVCNLGFKLTDVSSLVPGSVFCYRTNWNTCLFTGLVVANLPVRNDVYVLWIFCFDSDAGKSILCYTNRFKGSQVWTFNPKKSPIE